MERGHIMGFGSLMGTQAANIANAIGDDLDSLLTTGETKDKSMDAIANGAMAAVNQSDAQRKGVMDTLTSGIKKVANLTKSAGPTR